MTARRLRVGAFNTVAATGEFYGYGDEPDVFGAVVRHQRHYDWWITAAGRELASGRAWTERGAWAKASAAAHRPGLTKAVTR